MAAKSSSRGSVATSESVYIEDGNHDKENIEDQENIGKISSKESVHSQELKKTPQIKKRITYLWYISPKN